MSDTVVCNNLVMIVFSQARSCSGQWKTPVPKSRNVNNWTLLFTSRSGRRIPATLFARVSRCATDDSRSPCVTLRARAGAIPTAPHGLSRVLGQARESRKKAPISVSQPMALHCYEDLRK